MSDRPRRSFVRGVERFVLGIGMGVIAFVIERRVLRSIKRKGEEPFASGSKGTAALKVQPAPDVKDRSG